MSALPWHDRDFKWHICIRADRRCRLVCCAQPGDVVVTSVAAMFVWFPFLIFCLSGSQNPLPANTQRDPLQFPWLNLFIQLWFIGCTCEMGWGAHIDRDVEKDGLFNLSSGPPVMFQSCTTWTQEGGRGVQSACCKQPAEWRIDPL